jgi:ornithine--oxo-acid transaminase
MRRVTFPTIISTSLIMITASTTSSTTSSDTPRKLKQGNESDLMQVSSAEAMEMEYHFSAHNYHPLPVVYSRASAAKVWDPEGREYLDFLSAC